MRWNMSVAMLTLLVSLSSRTAEAQRWFNPRRTAVTFEGYPVWAWGPVYGTGNSPGAQYLTGTAQVIRAQGIYREAASRAALDYEAARSAYSANRKAWTETYFAMREENESKRLAKLHEAKYSKEVLDAAAHSAVPRRLSFESWDPITGKLLWPEPLQRPEFAAPRATIERLVEIRATTGSTDAAELGHAIRDLIELLKANIDALEPNDYIACRKFLDSLAYTVQG